jgi:hypothetical protein
MNFYTRLCAMLLSCLIAFEGFATAQTRPALTIIVVEGEGYVNDIQRGLGRAPVIEVRDENDKPVAGARLTFSLPERGPGGSFFGSGLNLNILTNEQGRATAAGFRPNSTEGRFQIRVSAVQGDRSGTVSINQSNAQPRASATAKPEKKFWKSKLFAVIAVGAIAGTIAATHGGDDTPATTTPGTTISAGTISVGSPR